MYGVGEKLHSAINKLLGLGVSSPDNMFFLRKPDGHEIALSSGACKNYVAIWGGLAAELAFVELT
jgi:hypothetical protein